MFELGNDDASVITLGQLRQFLNETCRSLPDEAPIMLNSDSDEDTGELVAPCMQILADEDSLEFYHYKWKI